MAKPDFDASDLQTSLTTGQQERALIKASPNLKETDVQGGKCWGAALTRPSRCSWENFTYRFLGGESKSNDLVTETGETLDNEFQTNASLSASYAGVTGSTGMKYLYKAQFKTTSYYALHCHNHPHDWIYPEMITALQALPAWSETQEVYDKDFSAIWVRGTSCMWSRMIALASHLMNSECRSDPSTRTSSRAMSAWTARSSATATESLDALIAPSMEAIVAHAARWPNSRLTRRTSRPGNRE
ncbi:hypothetical protein BJX96DRAFT_148876 [Aspergillus floccosus]